MKHIQSIFNDVPKAKGYDKISKREKEIADEIYNTCAYRKTDTNFKQYERLLPKKTTGINVIKALMVQHFPYTCINQHWYNVIKHTDGTRILIIDLKMFDKYNSKNNAIRKEIERIVDKYCITEKTTDLEKAFRLAQALYSSCAYDSEDKYGYDSYSALIKRCTICCGFSEAYKALCDYCNVRCQCVSSVDHMWNRVKINGKWLNVDITWCLGGRNIETYILTDDKTFYENHPPIEKKEAHYWKFK